MFLTYQLNESIDDNLKWLRSHNELCDVLLMSGSQKILAHSCVLGSHSPVLAAILQARLAVQNDWSILKPLIISIDEDDKCSNEETSSEDGVEISILELLITFLYGEKISIHTTRIQELMSISKLLGLSQHFSDFTPNELSNDHEDVPVRKKSRRKQPEPKLHTAPQPQHGETIPLENGNVKPINSQDVLPANSQISSLQKLEKSKVLRSKRKQGSKTCIKVRKEAKSKPLLTEDHNRPCKNSSLLNNELISHGEKCFPSDIPNRLLSEASNSSTLIPPDNFIDAESWFKNELLNDIDMKVIIKCEDAFSNSNINLIGNEERSLSAMNPKTNLIVKASSKTQMKRASRVATSCSVCKSSFHKAADFIKHVKEEKHFSQICPLCFVQLDEYEEQKNHFLQHDHPLPFFCFCCDLRFRSRAGLAMHAPKHSNTKPYTCEECGRGFKWRHAAQAHSITHRSHCHLLCDICGFSSKYMSTFKSHLKRHYDQFFPCPHPGCEFKSFRKAHLNDHVATHARLRPHQCDVCGHSFSLAKNLHRHMRLHTPDTCFLKCAPYSNEECGFKTTRPDKLRFHLVQKHNLEYHDKISLPVVVPSPRLSLEEETSNGTTDFNKESLTVNGMKEYSNFQPQQFKDKGEGFTLGALSTKSLNENKGIEVSGLSSEIGDILLDDQNTMLRSEGLASNSLCIPDSYETFIIPTSTHENTVIVSENMNYGDQGIEGDATLVLMENIEVLNTISQAETVSSSSDGMQSSSFNEEKGDSSTNKIEEMMNNLPMLLQTEKSMSYLEEDTVSLNQENPNTSEFTDANLDEFGLNRGSDNISLDDANTNIQLIKLPDGSIGFLPHVQQGPSSLSVEDSSIILEEEDGAIKETEEFKAFNSSQFNLNSLF